MTFQDIIRGLTIELDKVDSITLPEITTEIKLYYLNKSILKKTVALFSAENKVGKGFEENTLRTSELQRLVTESSDIIPLPFTPVSFNKTVSYIDCSLPIDYMFYVKNDLNYQFIKRNCLALSTPEQTTIKIVQLDDVDKVLKDPFSKPSLNDVIGVFINNKLRFYFDNSCTLTKLIVVYLRKPLKITDNTTTWYSDFSRWLLNQIITECCSAILEAVESERLQTIQNELNKTD
jgi:hypothetical protein